MNGTRLVHYLNLAQAMPVLWLNKIKLNILFIAFYIAGGTDCYMVIVTKKRFCQNKIRNNSKYGAAKTKSNLYTQFLSGCLDTRTGRAAKFILNPTSPV